MMTSEEKMLKRFQDDFNDFASLRIALRMADKQRAAPVDYWARLPEEEKNRIRIQLMLKLPTKFEIP